MVTPTIDCQEHGRAGATADAIDNIPTVVVGAAGPSVAEGDARCPICLEVRDACGALVPGSVEGFWDSCICRRRGAVRAWELSAHVPHLPPCADWGSSA